MTKLNTLLKRIKRLFFTPDGHFKIKMGCIFLFIAFVLYLLIAVAIIEGTKFYKKQFPIEATNAHLEWKDGEIYACVTIHNETKWGNITKVDLWQNKSNADSSNITTSPVECNIQEGDSATLRFLINPPYEDFQIYSGFTNQDIVVRFADGEKVYYGDIPQVEHHFKSNRSCTKPKPKEDNSFKFLGAGIDREENFNDPTVEVTTDNIHHLYREYEVEQVPKTDLYRIRPHKLYTTSEYFTRLIKFKDGRQVAAATFYGWNIPFIFIQNSQYMAAFNSLATTAGLNNSTFTAKTVLLDKNLNVVKQHEFKYKQQPGTFYDYIYIDTLIQKKNGYDYTAINIGFDSDDYCEHKGHVSFSNSVTEYSKKTILRHP